MNKRISVLLVIVYLFVTANACSPKLENSVNIATSVFPTSTAMKTSTQVRPTLLPTQSLVPTATSEPLTAKELWLQKHEEERLRFLKEQGPAIAIPALEYHGDDYIMQFTEYMSSDLTPEAFSEQMRWFHDNKVHAVTGDELVRWLDGKIELPKQSVILTFDLVGSEKALVVPRMVEAFELYGMHGIFAIQLWTSEIGNGQSWCEDDKCWQNYRDAYNSGTVTIADHSLDHPDFALFSESAGLRSLAASKSILEKNIGGGLTVDIMAWPYESVPTWANSVKTIGYAVSFGGSTYHIEENALHRDRTEDRYILPRVFPPNSDGLSMQPYGKTMKEMMEMYWDLDN